MCIKSWLESSRSQSFKVMTADTKASSAVLRFQALQLKLCHNHCGEAETSNVTEWQTIYKSVDCSRILSDQRPTVPEPVSEWPINAETFLQPRLHLHKPIGI